MVTNKINPLDNKRIFLVEDDVLNLAVVQEALRKSNVRLFQNYNSIGIVVHIEENLPIDLILLDINLRRGISGYDVMEQLKTNNLTAAIPVVAVSSLDPEIAIPKAQEMGFSGFISKPINTNTFANDLAAVLRGQKRWVVSR